MESPLRAKLTARLYLPFVLFGVLAFVILYFAIGRLSQQSAEAQLALHGEQIAALLTQLKLDDLSQAQFIDVLKKDAEVEDVCYFAKPEGRLIWSLRGCNGYLANAQLSAALNTEDFIRTHKASPDAVVWVELNKKHIKKTLRDQQGARLVLIVVLLLALYGVVAITLRRNVFTPMNRLLESLESGQTKNQGEQEGSDIAEFQTVNDRVQQLFLALKDREQSLSTVIENNPGVFYRLSKMESGWRVSFISLRVMELTGYPLEFFYQTNHHDILQLVHPLDRLKLAEAIKRAVENREPYYCEYRMVRKDGGIRELADRGLARFNSAGQLIAVEGLIVDNSELKQTIARYNEAEDIACMGSWHFDLETKKINWSPGVYKLFDLDPSKPEPDYETHLQQIHPDDRLKFSEPVDRAIATGESWEVEYRNNFPEEAQRYLLGRGRVVHDFNGNIIALSGTVQDITERKKLEQVLITAKLTAEQSDRMKSLFLASMSHEIRTPLNGIIGAAKILSRGNTLSERQVECVDMISRCGRNLSAIISDVLDLATIEAGKMRLDNVAFDLRAEIETVVLLYAENAMNKGLEFACQIDVPVPSLLIGDPVRLKQVLSNLLDNAIKFTDSGNILLRVIMQELTDNRVKLSFRVKDTGIGIAQEKQHYLFREFTQLDADMSKKYRGTGLGLSICKRIAELMGGEINVQSEIGVGSEFYLNIWMEREAFERKNSSRKFSALLLSARRHMRRGLALQLQYLNCRCTEVTTVDAAIEEINRAAAKQQNFTFIVVDEQVTGDLSALPAQTSARIWTVLLSTGSRPAITAGNAFKFDSVLTYPVRDLAWKNLFEAVPGLALISTAPRTTALEKRILIVDDSATDARLLEMQLDDQGFEVDCVRSGYSALEAVKLHNYALIFMDIKMAGISGLETVRIIRQTEPPGMFTPIIGLTTAISPEHDREQCLAAGMNDFYTKPIDELQLQSICGQWLKEKNSGPAGVGITG